MITTNDKFPAGHVFAVDTSFSGMVTGDARVLSDRLVEMHGMITGDLYIEPGASVTIHGMVNGAVINDGGFVEILGMVGRVVDLGAIQSTIHPGAVVHG